MTPARPHAAVAGVAVALTVVALAVGEYVAAAPSCAARSTSALRDRAQRSCQAHPTSEPATMTAVGRGRAHGDVRSDAAARGDAVRRRRGLRAVRLAGGTDRSRPARRARPALPVDARAQGAGRRRHRPYFSDATVNGVHLRVLTVGRGPHGAVQVARPLTEVDHALDAAAARARSRSAASGIARGRAARRARGPRGARAGLALHAPHRGADRQPRPRRSGSTIDGQRRARPPGAQLQRDARRARALGRGAAPPRRRCEPRAAHADREPARQHPDARGRRPAAARTSARACAPTSSPSSTS